jgi:hypothetical protein
MLITAEGVLVVPPVSGVEPTTIDMAKVVKGQARIQEIATLNPANAAGLLAFFLGCWQDLHDANTKVTEVRDRAEDALKRAKAEALLGADEKIKSRNGKPSADLREATVLLDETVRAAQETTYQVQAVLSWVRGRSEQFEAAWRSVRTLIDSTRTPPPRLSGDGPAPAPFGAKERQAAEAFKAAETTPDVDDPLPLPPGLVGTVDYNRRY